MPCRKKTGRKTAFIPKRTTIPCRTPLPLPGTGKNFRHDTHPAKPSEIHERTKTSAKRPDNRDIPFAGRIDPHHRCPPGMNRIPSVTTRISRLPASGRKRGHYGVPVGENCRSAPCFGKPVPKAFSGFRTTGYSRQPVRSIPVVRITVQAAERNGRRA